MFLVLQIPLFDVRNFIGDDETKLTRPHWERPEIGQEFLHRVGGFKRRCRGGIREWLGEDYYCTSRRWLRFPCDSSRAFTFGGDNRAHAMPLFRRWFSDGTCVVRLEVGWRIHVPASTHVIRGNEIEAFLDAFLAREVEVRKVQVPGRADWEKVPLLRLPKKALEAYIYASSERDTNPAMFEPWWVQKGRILAYLDSSPAEIGQLPRSARVAAVPQELGEKVVLSMIYLDRADHEVRAWVVSRDIEDTMLRHLRICLLRMNAELEGMEHLLVGINHGYLTNPEAVDTDAFAAYLGRLVRRFEAPEDQGGATEAFRAAFEAYASVTDGRVQQILTQLALMEPEIKDKFETFFRRLADLKLAQTGSTARPYFDMSKIIVRNNKAPVAVAKASGGGDATANATQTTTNNVSSLPEFKAALEELETTVKEAVAKLTDEHAKAALEQHLEAIKKEGKNRAWYDVSAQGLKEAAEAVGAIAAPVAKAAVKIIQILGPIV
jgi:hypothetical protein